MRFYFFSLFSWVLYFTVAGVAVAALTAAWATFKLKFTNPIYWTAIGVFAVLPWIEELQIAYHFDKFCRKDAGIVVSSTVAVDGFYDDTSGWGPRQLEQVGYHFVESRDIIHRRLLRVERADAATRQRALEWYSKKKPGGEESGASYVVHTISDREEVIVSPNRVDAWLKTTIDKPTARYRYKTLNSHTPVSHEIKRFENVVIDTATGQVLARFVNYYRGAYWFFISLGAPTIPCKETEAAVRKLGTLSIWSLALKPKSPKS